MMSDWKFSMTTLVELSLARSFLPIKSLHRIALNGSKMGK